MIKYAVIWMITLTVGIHLHAGVSICPGTVNPDPALLACWDFNTPNDVIQSDLSGNNHHMVLEGEAEWVTGVQEWALELDSQQYGIVQSLGDQGFETGDYSISVWVRSDNANELIFSLVQLNTQNARTEIKVILEITGGRLFLGELVNGGRLDGVQSIHLGSVLSTWHNVVAVKEDNRLKLFVNAVEVDSGAATENLGNANRFALSEAVYVGGILGQNYKTVDLDEMALWNRALSINEIDSIYQANVNDLPVFISTPDTLAIEEALYTYAIVVSDPNGDSTTLELIAGPPGMFLSGDTLYWTPDDPNLGNNPIVLHAKDEKGGTQVQQFSIRVINVNDAPVISSEPATNAVIGLPYTYQVVVDDPDPDDSLTYELLTAPAGMVVSMNGTVAWIPSSGQLDDYGVSLKVTDAAGAEAIQSYQVSVGSGNAPPIINTLSLADAVEDVPYSTTLNGTDPEGSPLSWTLLSGPQGLTLSASGLVAFTPVDSQTGQSLLTVIASDGIYGDTVALPLNIIPVNDPPQISGSVPGAKVYNADSAYSLLLEAFDEEGAVLQWFVEQAPAGIQINGSTMNWTPNSSQAGLDTMLLIASDGETSDTLQHIMLILGPASVGVLLPQSIRDLRVEQRQFSGVKELSIYLPQAVKGRTFAKVYSITGRLMSHSTFVGPGRHTLNFENKESFPSFLILENEGEVISIKAIR